MKKWIIGSLALIFIISIGMGAFQFIKYRAEKGQPEAIIMMAKFFSLEKAAPYLDKAITEDIGSDRSLAAKGIYTFLYSEGVGTEKDYSKAMEWAYKAVTDYLWSPGSKEDVQQIASEAFNAQPEDLDKIYSYPFVEFIQSEADQGNTKALYILFNLHMLTDENKDQAIEYLKAAADKGLGRAQRDLGRYYLSLNPPQFEEVAKWSCMAAESEIIESQIDCAMVYISPASPPSLHNKVLSYFWISRAIDHTNMPPESNEFALENMLALRHAKENNFFENIQKKMSAEEIEQGKQKVSEWKQSKTVQ